MTDQSPTVTRVRQAIMLNPRRAVEHLLRSIESAEDADTGGAELIELRILAAETYHRLGQTDSALRLATTAVTAAAMPGTSDRLVLAAAAVHADTILVAGNPDPIGTCERYVATVRQSPCVDERRVVVATAMHAVAVYHYRNCTEGQELLQHLLTSAHSHDDPLAGMLAAAITAMHTGCRGGQHQALVGYPPPVPGAALHPDLDAGSDYLAARVRAGTGAHIACGAVIRHRNAPTTP